MAKIAKIGTVRIPGLAKLPIVALPVVGLRGTAGGGAAGYWPAGTPEAIRQACMLWYDIARQGCTNEGMAADPVLRDLSGNGHDATCHNFAWSGMSGIGGYATNYNTYGKYAGVEVNDHVITSTTVEEGVNYNWLVFIDAKTNEVPSYKIRVTGTTSLTGLTYRYVDENNTVQYFNIQGDGEYTLPAIHHYNGDAISQNCGFQITHREPLLIIEQLPLYPGALVSDGVDDYAIAERLPLLTKENGYTVVCRRVILDNPTNFSVASKCMDTLHLSGILFEAQDSTNKFVQTLSGNLILDGFESGEVSWLTSQIYNGSPLNGTAERADNDFLILFKFHKNGGYGKVALYSFLLFNRDLTEEEIEWVKTNMMQQ